MSFKFTEIETNKYVDNNTTGQDVYKLLNRGILINTNTFELYYIRDVSTLIRLSDNAIIQYEGQDLYKKRIQTSPGTYMVTTEGYFLVEEETGETVFSPEYLSPVAFTGKYNDLNEKPLMATIPVPKIKFSNAKEIITFKNNDDSIENIVLDSAPIIRVCDFDNLVFKNYEVRIEMVMYKNKTRRKGGYIVPSPYYVDKMDYNLFQGFSTRTGKHLMTENGIIGVSRPNHYKVISNNQDIDVYEYLNGRFKVKSIGYYNSDNEISYLDLFVPIGMRVHNSQKFGKYGYSPSYKPLYFAFRYILVNRDKKEIISGPLSKTLVMRNKVYPFNFNFNGAQIYNKGVCDVPGGFIRNEFRCFYAD